MEMKAAINALGALAQDARLAVFRLLIRQGAEGLPAGIIAERLGVPAATLSFHLAQLGHAGLIDSRREGRFIIYSANIATMRALLTFLLEDCCQGHPELCGVVPVGADDGVGGEVGAEDDEGARPCRSCAG